MIDTAPTFSFSCLFAVYFLTKTRRQLMAGIGLRGWKSTSDNRGSIRGTGRKCLRAGGKGEKRRKTARDLPVSILLPTVTQLTGPGSGYKGNGASAEAAEDGRTAKTAVRLLMALERRRTGCGTWDLVKKRFDTSGKKGLCAALVTTTRLLPRRGS